MRQERQATPAFGAYEEFKSLPAALTKSGLRLDLQNEFSQISMTVTKELELQMGEGLYNIPESRESAME